MPSISFVIKEEDYPNFENAFLKENPIPIDSILTPLGWLEEWGRQQYLKAVERGQIKIAQESVVVKSDVIVCSLTK